MTACAPEAARVSRVGRCTYSCGRPVVAHTGATLEGCLDAALAPRGCVRANTHQSAWPRTVSACARPPRRADARACVRVRCLHGCVGRVADRTHETVHTGVSPWGHV